ncbi:MAG TPA: hypothetical protein VEG25_00245 [Burkholderiales bacterium]|nr:hypothetical protein [Burkholderiales bacterium]
MNTIGTKSRGAAFLGWLLATPFLIIAIVIVLLILAFGFYEGRKAYWDSKVREMCEKDGGVRVYEKIPVSDEQYNKLPKVNGSPAIVSEANSKPTEPAFAVDSEIVLREWEPRVTRWESLVKRRSDGKIIGQMVSYYRVGGDFPLSFGHPTSFVCPERMQFYADEAEFFVIQGKAK